MSDFFNTSNVDVHDETLRAGGGSTNKQGSDNQSNQNIAHVSCSQIARLTRQEDGLILYRQKINTIIVIGVVLSVEELTTKNVYIIDDHTPGSPIEVQLWKNSPEGSDGSTRVSFVPPTVLERTYIRVTGKVSYSEQKPFVIAFHIETITNPNLIQLHFFQIIHDALFLEKRKNHTLNSKGESDTSTIQASDMSGANNGGFTQIQRGVLNILGKHRDSTCGLKRNEIHNYMTGVSPKQIDDAIQFLVDEGHIFSTVDENTFKVTFF